MGNPAPLLLYVSVAPLARVMTTVKEDIEDFEEMRELKL